MTFADWLVAASFSHLITALYVGSLYLSKSTRPSKLVRRDDEVVVKKRMQIISAGTLVDVLLITPLVLHWQLMPQTDLSWTQAIKFMNIELGPHFFTRTVPTSVLALIHVAILFAGPLYQRIYLENGLPLGFHLAKRELKTVWGIRNYIVGPITEELVFRACIMSVHKAAGYSGLASVFITPLYFGVAHLHHGYELYVSMGSKGKNKVMVIALQCAVQLVFTTLFGWYAAWLYVRFQSVWPPVCVHIFCNAMGVPDFSVDGVSKKQFKTYQTLLAVGFVGFLATMTLLIRW